METLFYSLFIAASLHAQPPTDANCYEILMDKPQLAEAEIAEGTKEIWCYQQATTPRVGTFIYNADQDQVLPELSLLKDEAGEVTHASLLQGELTYHKVNAKDFNPFPVPLDEPRHLPRVITPRFLMSEEATNQVFQKLIKAHDTEEAADLSTRPGTYSAAVATVRLPWRGYWWPQRGQTLAPTLHKYDTVLRANGLPSNAVGWEASRHAWGGAWWEGHCNGWAAASILRREPRNPRVISGVEFSVGNQKGLLAEKDYCVKAAFFGGRSLAQYISPQSFHKTLRYYIGNLGKPVAMDYQPSGVVDNHVISGYSMRITNRDIDSLEVTAVLQMHKYDGKNTDEVGVAPRYTRTYRYVLNTDVGGVITSGYWISGNPDFMWVPLSPSTCRSGNSWVNEEWVQAIIFR